MKGLKVKGGILFMKEATGELNATVVIVIIVAMLVAFFYFTIWPVIRNNMNQNISCSKAICDCANPGEATVTCYIYEKNQDNPIDQITCPNKGNICK